MIQKIYWMSDTHIDSIILNELDLNGYRKRNIEYIHSFCDNILKEKADCVLITGDISVYKTLRQDLEILEEKLRIPIFYICGNHDFYYGSKDKLNSLCKEINSTSSYLKWLGDGSVIELNETTALIGHDGFYDIQYGYAERSRLMMSDFHLIEDFKYEPHQIIVQKARKFAKESAEAISSTIDSIKTKYKTIYIATHMPLYPETSLYDNKMSDGTWMPYFTNKIMGDTLKQIAIDNPNTMFKVFAGHTHHEANVKIEHNIFAHVAYANYGQLFGKIIEVE